LGIKEEKKNVVSKENDAGTKGSQKERCRRSGRRGISGEQLQEREREWEVDREREWERGEGERGRRESRGGR